MIWGALQAPGCNVQLWLRITDLPKLLQFAKEETEVQGDEMLTLNIITETVHLGR